MFDFAGRIPVARETADPWVFLAMIGLVAATAAGLVFAHDVFPGDDNARGYVIQLAAGMLVILGAYFTAVNIREARAQQAFDRLCRAIEQLGSDSEPVRVGAVRLLESIALEKLELPTGSAGDALAARQKAIREALALVSAERDGRPSVELAQRVLGELEARTSRG
jgi:hypothetical protein